MSGIGLPLRDGMLVTSSQVKQMQNSYFDRMFALDEESLYIFP